MSLRAKIKSLVCLSSILICLFLCAYCAEAIKLNVDPPRVEIALSPKEGKRGNITVFNFDENKPIHVKAYLSDLVYLPDGSNDFISAGTTPWSCADWLKISPSEFDIAPNGETKLRYVVDIPQGARGGRYGVVFFEVLPSLKELKDKSGAAVNIRIGTIFLITAKGTENSSAELQDLIVGKPDEKGAFEIFCNIKNAGNILIRPNGSVKIIDAAGVELAELLLNEVKSGVLPGTSRQFSVKYDKGKLTSGEYVVQVVLDYGGDVLLGGQISFKIP